MHPFPIAVDCTAAEAAAWFFDPITKKGITRNKFSAFLRVAQHTGTNLVNERTFATVISNQISFFKPREFVDKRIWKVEDSGSVKIAVWPEQEISCDYGEYFGDTVRCFTKALFCATDVDAANSESSLKQCNVTLTKFIQGRRPTLGSRSAYTYDLLRTVNHLCEDLRQDEKVDKATLEDFLKRLKNDEISHDYSQEDKAMLERGSVLFKMLTGRSSDLRVQLKSSHTAVTARCGFTNDGDAKYFAAYSSVVVDADVDSCLAYAYLMDSRERMMSSNYSIISKIHKKTGDHSCIVLNKLKSKLGKRRRQAIMLSKVIWKRNLKSKTAMLYMEDNEELKRSMSVLKNVDAKIIKNGFSSAGHKVVLLLKKLPVREGKVAQTWLKLYSVVDLNSLDALPRKHKMTLTKSFTEVASAMRQRFDRAQDIDLKNMAKVSEQIKNTPVNSNVLAATIFYANIAKPPVKKHRLKSSYPLAEAWAHVDDKGKGWGSTTVLVKASAEEAAAYFWDFTSKCRSQETGDLERKVLDEPGTWHSIVMRRHRVDGGLSIKQSVKARSKTRTFPNHLFLEVVDEDTVLIMMKPVTKDDLFLEKVTNQIQDGSQLASQLQDTQSKQSNRKSSNLRLFPSMNGLTHVHAREIASEKTAIRITRMNDSKAKIEFVTEIVLEKGAKKEGKSKKATPFSLRSSNSPPFHLLIKLFGQPCPETLTRHRKFSSHLCTRQLSMQWMMTLVKLSAAT